MSSSSLLFSFVYPPPPSVFVTAMSAISFASLANTGAAEVRGQHLNYSKFWNAVTSTSSNASSRRRRLPSREGMLLLYAPALVAALASFAIPGAVVGERARWLSAALSIHFFKRVMEVLFIHQYSGHMLLGSALPISFSYFIGTATMIYAQYLTQPMSEPANDLKYIGVALFFVGLAGNLYHHYLLSKLRTKGEKEYKIPRGGLFDLVVCPHYLFEILGFFGFSLISQTVYAFSFAFGTMLYLIGRSHATRKWYLSKFDQFPKHVKALIPYVF